MAEPVAPFALTSRPSQRPPPGDWRTWLFMGGRGSGKTRAGAEWVRFAALFAGRRRIALIGPAFHDVREVMIEGVSGLRAISRPGEKLPQYEVSRHRLVWPNGAEAFAFSSADPDSLRGPQFDAAWCDEAAAWPGGLAVWDMLQMGLRLGEDPRAILTTTPRPVPLIRKLVDDPSVVVTRARTSDNSAHLAPGFLDHVGQQYAGTRLGRQELEGELLEEADGALWTYAMLERARASSLPLQMSDVIIAVDPPASIGAGADACGIIAAASAPGKDGHSCCFILADATVQGRSPLDWAGEVGAMARRVGASRVVAEANQGGEMVRTILSAAGCPVPVQLVHAHLSKRARALPVVALYEQGRVMHAGCFQALEDEMLAFGTAALKHSPDRVDALVWAVGALTTRLGTQPHIRRL